MKGVSMQIFARLISRRIVPVALVALLCAPALASESAAHKTQVAHARATAATAPVTFANLDANHDGAISAVEAERNTGLKDAFAGLDTDGNGKLSAAEFAKFGAPVATGVKRAATVPTGTATAAQAAARHGATKAASAQRDVKKETPVAPAH